MRIYDFVCRIKSNQKNDGGIYEEIYKSIQRHVRRYHAVYGLAAGIRRGGADSRSKNPALVERRAAG